MNNLPQVCKDCADYGSDFCTDCLEELTKDLPEDDKPVFNDMLKNLAKAITEK